ncbi:hypothetical protein EIN_313120 [Entamoeba invadens IP1]|uniref:Rho-GAP domain-containing protein n=1 Tax=Entamoeba invadens IP1 TaxID=370355 RepID=A0A0A1UFS5_ENTIV|nr:hypothetical protein EIN_313120 [Entamoeba invadens IP1]ELP92930.1 hypothetical protein EIN_313120 [Entamoeba invadens IP1]|eukprot:XP_004259701.1 hypothetical protein EIN_313120 [Entamoeba invadens IP1]
MKRFVHTNNPFYSDKLDAAEFYWKRHEDVLKEIRRTVEILVFHLNSLQTTPFSRISFHCKKDRVYMASYNTAIENMTKHLQQFSDTLHPIVSFSSEFLDNFQDIRKKLKDKKKEYNNQLAMLYHFNTMYNESVFSLFAQITQSCQEFFTNAQSSFSGVDKSSLDIVKAKEHAQYVEINELKFVEYFKVNLIDILNTEQRTPKQLPLAIAKTISMLNSSNLSFKGLFRFTPYADSKEIDQVTRRISVTDITEYSVDVIACVLKCFLQNLKKHVFPTMASLEMISIHIKSGQMEVNTLAKKYQNIITQLPEESITMLCNVIAVCKKIANHSKENGMNQKNLGVVLAPILLTLPDPETLKNTGINPNTTKEIGYGIEIVKFIITNYDLIFTAEIVDGRECCVDVQDVTNEGPQEDEKDTKDDKFIKIEKSVIMNQSINLPTQKRMRTASSADKMGNGENDNESKKSRQKRVILSSDISELIVGKLKEEIGEKEPDVKPPEKEEKVELLPFQSRDFYVEKALQRGDATNEKQEDKPFKVVCVSNVACQKTKNSPLLYESKNSPPPEGNETNQHNILYLTQNDLSKSTNALLAESKETQQGPRPGSIPNTKFIVPTFEPKKKKKKQADITVTPQKGKRGRTKTLVEKTKADRLNDL